MSEGTSPGATATATAPSAPAAGNAPASANAGAGDGPTPALSQITAEPAGAGHVNIGPGGSSTSQAGAAGSGSPNGTPTKDRETVASTSRGKDSGTDAQAAPAGDDPPAAQAGGKGWKVDDLPDGAKRHIEDLRRENAATRKANQESAGKVADLETKLSGLMEGLSRVFGGGPADGTPAATPPDPEKLTAQLDEMTGNHRDLAVRLAVWEKGHEHGANVTELMDSAAFLDALKKLDPASPDFTDDLGRVVTAAIDRNPSRFKAQAAQAAPAPPPVPSGGEFTGGPGAASTDLESMDVDGFRELRKKHRPL